MAEVKRYSSLPIIIAVIRPTLPINRIGTSGSRAERACRGSCSNIKEDRSIILVTIIRGRYGRSPMNEEKNKKPPASEKERP